MLSPSTYSRLSTLTISYFVFALSFQLSPFSYNMLSPFSLHMLSPSTYSMLSTLTISYFVFALSFQLSPFSYNMLSPFS